MARQWCQNQQHWQQCLLDVLGVAVAVVAAAVSVGPPAEILDGTDFALASVPWNPSVGKEFASDPRSPSADTALASDPYSSDRAAAASAADLKEEDM